MILTKTQFEAAHELGKTFYNNNMLTARVALALGTRVFFTPQSIEVHQQASDGTKIENYTLLEDFRIAYSGEM